MNKILIIGNGQVGSALKTLFGGYAQSVGRSKIDLSKPELIQEKLEALAPKVIINAAAYTAVDKAEEEEELALAINATSVGKLAEFAFANDIPFVHYSTDYVFAGDGNAAWKENDKTDPQNAYGRTKLAGEEAIKTTAKKYDNPKYLIFRTSWVYDETGNNFVNTMLRLGTERESLGIINDQMGAPTYAADIAEYTSRALGRAKAKASFPSGVYHLCNSGETSWFGFANAIFNEAQALGLELKIKDLNEIPTSDYPTPAKRPLNSRLNLRKLKTIFDIRMPEWDIALKRCMKNKDIG